MNPKNDNQNETIADITLKTQKNTWITGQLVTVNVQNNLDKEFVLGENQYPPENIIFEKWFNGKWERLVINDIETEHEKTVLPPKTKKSLSFSKYNNQIFNEIGNYRISIKTDDQELSTEFKIKSPGVLRSLWRTLFFKPIFNILIFFVSVFPGHSLALAILALTLLIKLILLGPSKKAMIQQQKMQKVQKEIELMRKKHAGDQQKIAQETLALWKKHNVNPFGTFLPMFIQLPVMIALFFVVQEGLLPHNSVHLWAPLKDFSLDLVNSNLFGLDLASVGILWLAILVGFLQFASMKLMLLKKKNEKKKNDKKQEKDDKETSMNQMQIMNNVMTYGLPFLIGFFTFSMPAAVGYYWGISTIFSIGQQWFLNKEKHS